MHPSVRAGRGQLPLQGSLGERSAGKEVSGMLMDVHFDNQKIESLMKKAEEQLRALDATVMQLHAAFELEGKEPPAAGTDGGKE